MSVFRKTPPELVRTRAGLALSIRLAQPEDEALLRSFFARVSDEDRRFRFFNAHAQIGHEQLLPMVEADHFRSESFLAFQADTGELVAAGMLACDNPLERAEVAVSVRADRRGMGIGWAMLDLLAAAAQRRGVREVIAIEDRANRAAIDLECENGFTPQPVEGDPQLVMLTRQLAA